MLKGQCSSSLKARKDRPGPCRNAVSELVAPALCISNMRPGKADGLVYRPPFQQQEGRDRKVSWRLPRGVGPDAGLRTKHELRCSNHQVLLTAAAFRTIHSVRSEKGSQHSERSTRYVLRKDRRGMLTAHGLSRVGSCCQFLVPRDPRPLSWLPGPGESGSRPAL